MKIREYKVIGDVGRIIKIALLADIHSNFDAAILKNISRSDIDIIAIAGDFVDTSLKENDDAINFLKKCSSISFTVFTPGNHDYLITEDDLKLMRIAGVHTLVDTWEFFNEELIVGGLASAFYNKCKKYDPKAKMAIKPNTSWLNDFEKQNHYRVLIDHHPENYELETHRRK